MSSQTRPNSVPDSYQDGYETVAEPPDWGKVWEDEKSVLREFGVDI